jgi:hypothetical protein
MLRLLPQQVERLHCWYYCRGFTKYGGDVASGGMIYIPSFIKIGSGIRAMLRFLPQQFEELQSWYY